MTTFADGVFQYGGAPVGVDLITNKIFAAPNGQQRKGRAWFVDPSCNGNGRSPAQAYATMQQAFDSVNSGDIIYFVGNVREQLVTPVQIFDVTVVGCGNRPRNADATPSGGDWAAATWRAPASGGVAGQATVRVLQQGWRFCNILFNMLDVNSAGIEIVRNSGAGDLERDASHCSVLGCMFAGAGIGIRGTATAFAENPYNVEIGYNKFTGCTYGIYAQVAQPNSWSIHHNEFQGCTNGIFAKLQNSIIGPGNVVVGFTAGGNTGGIDLQGGGGTNFVTGNYLGGTYSKAGGYNTEAGDQWQGNFGSGGVTTVDPA